MKKANIRGLMSNLSQKRFNFPCIWNSYFQLIYTTTYLCPIENSVVEQTSKCLLPCRCFFICSFSKYRFTISANSVGSGDSAWRHKLFCAVISLRYFSYLPDLHVWKFTAFNIQKDNENVSANLWASSDILKAQKSFHITVYREIHWDDSGMWVDSERRNEVMMQAAVKGHVKFYESQLLSWKQEMRN
jgi:hypothetical protein